jgi:predicted peroxiredoxin
MKNLSLLLICVFLLMSCKQQPKTVAITHNHADMAKMETGVKDGMFIHITESYNDPHRVLMPLKMAVMMTMDKDVIVYIDIKAVELLVKSSKDLNFAEFESAHTYIKQLIEKGAGVYACPTCLKIAGFKPEDLIAGVQVAQKDKFFDFTKGRIITLDY